MGILPQSERFPMLIFVFMIAGSCGLRAACIESSENLLKQTTSQINCGGMDSMPLSLRSTTVLWLVSINLMDRFRSYSYTQRWVSVFLTKTRWQWFMSDSGVDVLAGCLGVCVMKKNPSASYLLLAPPLFLRSLRTGREGKFPARQKFAHNYLQFRPLFSLAGKYCLWNIA